MALTRREFLFRSFGAFGAAALAFERFGLLDALAQSGDYKALVCIFLAGGNDADNVVVPFDDYQTYADVRAGTGLQLPKFGEEPTPGLLPVNVPRIGSQFGFHPRITGLHQLYTQGNLAVVCNVGNLVEPTTRQTYQNGTAQRPRSLFSHSDQVNEWQAGVSPNQFSSTGWCGRTADKVAGDPAPVFPVGVTIAGNALLFTGETQRPLAASPAPTAINQVLRLDGFQNPPENDLRYQAMQSLLQIDNNLTIVRGASGVTKKALDIEAALRAAGDPPVPPFPLNTTLGNQLHQVAKLIALRGILGMNRQIFFCSLGGFDTHNNQVAGNNPTMGTHANLWIQVSNAIKTFYDATVQLGIESQVTTFTISDFARTFKPNGGLGTDHAWGGHHFVAGGSVLGGDFYGIAGPNGTVFPTLVPNGPDDSDSGSGARGRWVPTSSVDQYGATLVKWFGISDADIAGVFPNIGRFGLQTLGFLPGAAV